MDEIIHFRTKVGSTRGIGNSLKTRTGRSTEIVDIRTAQIYDDARDIVWKKSTGTEIYTKNRHTTVSMDILYCVDDSILDEGKVLYAKHLDQALAHSSKQSGDSYTVGGNDRIFHEVLLPKNHLIFIAISSIDLLEYEKYKKLFGQNDVIFLSIYHPSEIEEGDEALFDSQVPTKKYYTELRKRMRQIDTKVHLLSGSNIVLRTSDIIPLKLNHFFKNRYG